jgi:hypothetical protein
MQTFLRREDMVNPSISQAVLTSAILTTPPTFSPRKPFEILLVNDPAHQLYNISLAVGIPPQHFHLLFDTRSTEL